MPNIVVANTKGGVGKSFISSQILPLAFSQKQMNVFEIDNNNKTSLSSNIIQFLNLNVKNVDQILFDIEFNENVNIIDAGGGDDTKEVIKALADNGVEIDLFVVPLIKDFEVVKNLKDTISLIKNNFNNPKIIVALNKVINNAEQEFIYFFGDKELGVQGIVEQLKDINLLTIKDYAEIDIVKNIYKTTTADFLAEYSDVLENEKEFRQKVHQEAKQKFKTLEEQRGFYAKQMQKLLLLKRLVKIRDNIQGMFKSII